MSERITITARDALARCGCTTGVNVADFGYQFARYNYDREAFDFIFSVPIAWVREYGIEGAFLMGCARNACLPEVRA